ncbi:MAG TPA: PspA/IM30 family protein [Anaerolineae bacterium]|nr:PspA/IM30 family protein [Anaerolineae bacterium]HNU03704.1 PspA/IM30 family protein [Anaerolineae bacterium]
MASLLEKVNILIKANLHYMADQALQANSVAVVNQYIREIENNLDDLNDAVATVGGQVKTIRRKRDEYQAKATTLDHNIDVFLTEGNEALAVAAQAKLNSTQRTVESYDQQLAQLEREYEALRSAKLKLEAKLATTKQEKDELQALMDLARAKEISNKAMRSLDDLAGAGDADVARVADAVRSRLDKASAESEMLASSLDKQMDDVLERGEIDAALMERKRRLGLAEG